MSPIKSLYRRATGDLAMCAAATATVPPPMQQAPPIVTPFNPFPFYSLATLATSTCNYRPSTMTSAPDPTPVVSSPSTTKAVDVDSVSNNSSSDTCRSTSSTATVSPNISKKERRLIMNRNSARLRRKRQSEEMDKMQSTVRDLEISNKRMRTENDELRKAIVDLKVLVQAKKQATTAGGVATSASTTNGVASTPPVASATKDARYKSLAATALAKYVTTGIAVENQEEKISPKPTLLNSTMSSKAVTTRSGVSTTFSPLLTNNVLLRSYLLRRAEALELLTRNLQNPSPPKDESSLIVSANTPFSSIHPNTSAVVDMASTTDEIEATKLAAQQLAALAFMG